LERRQLRHHRPVHPPRIAANGIRADYFLGALTAFLTGKCGLCGFGGGSAAAAGLCCRRILCLRGISLLAPVDISIAGAMLVEHLASSVSRGF